MRDLMHVVAGMAVCGAMLAVGCQQQMSGGSVSSAAVSEQQEAHERVAIAHIAPSRAAARQPGLGQTMGVVTFTQMGDRVRVVADITGLPPGKHGIHIHEKGDLSAADLSSAGGHFNPGHHPHGGPTTSAVHAGDLGNIVASEDGTAHLELIVDNISIGTGKANDILGKSVIIHAKADDLSSQPSGNAGARIAGGIIEPALK